MGPLNPAAMRFLKSLPPIDNGFRLAPITAIDDGWKMGKATSEWMKARAEREEETS